MPLILESRTNNEVEIAPSPPAEILDAVCLSTTIPKVSGQVYASGVRRQKHLVRRIPISILILPHLPEHDLDDGLASAPIDQWLHIAAIRFFLWELDCGRVRSVSGRPLLLHFGFTTGSLLSRTRWAYGFSRSLE